MKKEEIVITDKTIVLGIFTTNAFYYFESKGAVDYGEFYYKVPGVPNTIDVLDSVQMACNWAEKIIFVLDRVEFPINPSKSITCGELALICKNEDLFNKTIFVKGDNVIDFDRNLVI